MTRSVPVFAALAFFACASVIGQAPPDFSGRWTTDPDPAATAPAQAGPAGAPATGAPAAGQGPRQGAPGGRAASGDMGSGWGSTITITQNASAVTVEYSFFARGDMQPPLRFTYDLTGQPSTNTVMMGRGMQSQTSRTRWDGQSLVIVTTHAFADPATGKSMPADVTQRLSLASPASLLVETTRAGVMGAPSTTTRTVYRRDHAVNAIGVVTAPA